MKNRVILQIVTRWHLSHRPGVKNSAQAGTPSLLDGMRAAGSCSVAPWCPPSLGPTWLIVGAAGSGSGPCRRRIRCCAMRAGGAPEDWPQGERAALRGGGGRGDQGGPLGGAGRYCGPAAGAHAARRGGGHPPYAATAASPGGRCHGHSHPAAHALLLLGTEHMTWFEVRCH